MQRINKATLDSIFDIIATFVVDVYYNQIYLNSNSEFRAGDGSTLTNIYSQNIYRYLLEMKKNPNAIRHIIRKLIAYFSQVTSYTTITMPEFEDKILICFIPYDYYGLFTDREKDSFLNDVVKKSMDFGGHIAINLLLKRIIDDHKNIANTVLFKSKIIDELRIMRDSYYNEILSKITGVPQKTQAQEMNRLKDELKNQLQMRAKAESQNKKLRTLVKNLSIQLKDLLQNTSNNTSPSDNIRTYSTTKRSDDSGPSIEELNDDHESTTYDSPQNIFDTFITQSGLEIPPNSPVESDSDNEADSDNDRKQFYITEFNKRKDILNN